MNALRSMMILGLCGALATPASAEIGVLAAVNRDMTGARPAEPPRPVFIQERLVRNERIATSEQGGGQILFLDQTSLTLSPNSDIVLDEYVYDPDAQTGAIGVSVARGALRLVGGRITKTGEATIRTPTATIGIRGGIGQTVVAPDGTALHFHFAGISSTITSPRGSLTITREGGYARIALDGALEYLGLATPEALAAALSSGAGKGGGGGDASGAGGAVAAVAAVVSGVEGAVTAPAISTTGERFAAAFDEGPDPALESPSDDFATANLAEELAERPGQEMDVIVFSGLYAADINAGGTQNVTGNFPFSLSYSIAGGQGLASVSYPAELAPDLQSSGIEGQDFVGDLFIVVQDGDRIVEDPIRTTALFGSVDNADFTISTSDRLNGSFAINYQGTPIFTGIRSASGQIVDIGGIRIAIEDFDLAIDNLRDSLALISANN
ncbi:MAG: FecR domain-containing protein [Pikeienuella sp.]|uniref:FecR family protein n=1 Tax=Pikeienuella sp. TaxID=2831957 RepID=UPI00391C97A7